MSAEAPKAADPSRFQFTGGLLERSIYVEREADRALVAALLDGDYCHILAPRQIGKTSLCFRAARELAKRGVRCALVDVTAAGTPSTSEEWYFGLVDEIARRLRLPDPLDAWQARAGVAPAQRFRDFIRSLVENDTSGSRLVIFLDEIEMVRLSPIDVDDFLLILRSFHEERGQSAALGRLSFCLIGVTTPNDLIKNKSVTPFNVSKAIRVGDFTRAEIDALAPGLAGITGDTSKILDHVYSWTDGHPYMTMRACFEVARRAPIERDREASVVDDVVTSLFLERPLEDANINYAARRFEDAKFDRDGARLADKVQLYRRVLSHQDPPAHNESAVQMELRICGMVKDVEISPQNRVLRPRNRIYETALNLDWLRSKGDRRHLSDAVWRWLDSGKNDAALLRGVVLEKALAWAKTNILSEDEQAFVDASQRYETQSLEAERSRVTAEVAVAHTAQKEAMGELSKTRHALQKAITEKQEIENERANLAERQAQLRASVRTTRIWFYTALMGVLITVVIAAVVLQQTKSKLNQISAESSDRLSEMRRTQDQVNDLNKQIESLRPQAELLREKDEQIKKKTDELAAKQAELDQKTQELQKRSDEVSAKDDELRVKNQAVLEANRNLARNKDLADTLSRREKDLAECRTENTRLSQQLKRVMSTLPMKDDPYP
ncbi:MAG: AAA-like domain-containing protein [Polyangiaceae bacterium]|nr:AAA-like domain-containing protein [Polyangiaceae bacterium]